MVNWNTIEELRNLFIEQYTDTKLQNVLEKACSEEYELKRDYNGRQILELLQNVDDACEEKKQDEEVIVSISYHNNILEVGNTGTTFTKETIERLCLGRASEKSSQKIGNKGTGFRSLLNDAEWIELHSGDFAIRFSEEYTQKLFNQYCDEKSDKYNKIIVSQKNNWKKDYKFSFPIMNCPEKIEFDSKEFHTLIRIKIKKENESKETSILKQLEQPFYKSLLFLPKITHIIIETNQTTKEYLKKHENEYIVIEEKINNQTTSKPEKYFVFPFHEKIDEKEADVIIAVPIDKNYDFSNEKLYCYFPIRNFPTPINALIHAPFSTNNSRDDVPDDDEQINNKLFLLIIDLIKKVAEKLTKKHINNLAINTVVPNPDSKIWKNDSFNLLKTYYEKLATSKIWPTVNGKFISIKDSPKTILNSFPEEFNGKEFESLLVPLSPETYSFLIDFANYIQYSNLQYSDSELSNKITNIASRKNIETRIKLFLWSNSYFKTYKDFPILLKDTKDKEIKNEDKIYLPTDNGISTLPEELSWVKLCILKQEYVTEIIKQLKLSKPDEWKIADENSTSGGDKRTLATYSRDNFKIKFIEQTSYEQMISSINQQINTDFDKSKSFINWFFKEYRNKFEKGSELSKIHFNLPDSNKIIKPITDLYLGSNYGNQLADKLFNKTTITPLIDLSELYIGKDSSGFIEFLKKTEIQQYPHVKKQSISENENFKKYISPKYNIHTTINYLDSYSIDNFESLIKELDTKDIVEWLLKDSELKTYLLSTEASSVAKQQSNYYGVPFASNAYLKFILNTTPWISLENIKYPPCKIIKYEKLKNKFSGYYGTSEQDLITKLDKQIVNLFDFDFLSNMSEIPDNDLKKLLTELKNIDKSGEISRRLYLDIIKYKKDIIPTYSPTGIEVLCKDGEFYLNSKVQYADRKISKSEETKRNYIYIQPKQNTATIKNWLGVERYESSYELKDKEELIDILDDFNNEIKNIKISVLCLIEQNKTNIEKLKRLKIIPCSKIVVDDIEQQIQDIELDNYFYVENKNNYFIKLPFYALISDIRQSDLFALSIIEILKQALTLTLEEETSLLELLISKDLENKKRKIDDLYGVDKWNTSYELLFNKKILNEKVYSFYSNNNLNDELLSEISLIDFTTELEISEYETNIKSLKSISKDVIDLNNCIEGLRFTLVPYYQQEIKRIMNDNLKNYKSNLYNHIKINNLEEANKYLKLLDEYIYCDYSSFKFNNSICVSVTDFLYSRFPILNEKYEETFEPDNIYNENVKTVCSKLEISTSEFDFFIQHNSKYNSLLYFNIPNSICSDIQEFLKSKEESHNTQKNPKEENNNNSDSNDTSTEKTTLHDIPPKANKSNSGGPHGSKGRNGGSGSREHSIFDYSNQNDANDKNGKEAEKIAFDELSKTYKDLIWHSKYSEKLADRNNLPPDGIVCDMWNFDPKAGNLYFEIKSAINEFEMTINEYKSMMKHKENYEVVLVDISRRTISRHKFDELDQFKQIDSYKFTFVQEKLD